jgi:hypothetical protein
MIIITSASLKIAHREILAWLTGQLRYGKLFKLKQ